MVYAKLLRVLLNAGTPIEHLFPVDFDKKLYAKFPLSSQGTTGWGGAFQKYVDHLYDNKLVDTESCVNSSRV